MFWREAPENFANFPIFRRRSQKIWPRAKKNAKNKTPISQKSGLGDKGGGFKTNSPVLKSSCSKSWGWNHLVLVVYWNHIVLEVGWDSWVRDRVYKIVKQICSTGGAKIRVFSMADIFQRFFPNFGSLFWWACGTICGSSTDTSIGPIKNSSRFWLV